ncbi:MAG: DUF2125 domain-containing protein [Pseudomonadota bacterium]
MQQAFRTALAPIFGLIAFPAHADLTAQQVWDEFVALAAEAGQMLTVAETTQDGGQLVLRGVESELSVPDAEVTLLIDEITLTELGDGSVQYAFSDSYPVSVSMAGTDGQNVDLTMEIRHPELGMNVSGEPGALTYAYDAPTVEVDLQSLSIADQSVPADVSFSLDDVTGLYAVTGTDADSVVSQDLSIGTLSFLVSANVPDPEDPDGDPGIVDIDATIADITTVSEGSASSLLGFGAGFGTLPDGFAATSETKIGETNYSVRMEEDGQAMEFVGSAQSGFVESALSDGSVTYNSRSSDIDFNISGSAIPLPELALSIAGAATRFAMPLSPSDEAGDLVIGLDLNAIEIPDGLWGMFDAEGLLPRDPADIALALSGKGRWLIDIMDPNLQPESLTTPPGELEELTLDSLRIAAAGAEITGNGAFTIDNSGVGAFGPAPQPVGQVDFTITGVNGLMQNLTAIGLLPEEQAMMGQMMLGMFATPGSGPDTMMSKIEIDADGAIFANGQRIR